MFVFKSFAIIGWWCLSAMSAQTFNNNVTGPTTTSFITTTLATILASNYSNPTPFVPVNVSPISFQHTDAVNPHPHQHSLHLPTLPGAPQTNDAILFGNEVKSLSELPLETLLKIKRHLEEMTNGQLAQAENVVYPVYEPHPGGALSSGYLNLGGGTFHGTAEEAAQGDDVGFVTTNRHANSQFIENGDMVNFYDHSKTDYGHQQQDGGGGGGYITPQPFISKFKKKHASSDLWDEQKPSKIQTIFQVSVTALSFLAFGGYLLCMILAALKAKGTAYYPTAAALQANKRPALQNAPVKIQANKKRRPSYGRRRRRNTVIEAREQILPYNEDQMFHALISIAEGYVKFNDFYRK